MRGRRKPDERREGHYENRMHDHWKADDGVRVETDRRYAEMLARKEGELARAKERADAERRYHLKSLNEMRNNALVRKRSADEKHKLIESC